MAKYSSVSEAIADMSAKTNAKGKKVVNRFNKKNFNNLMIAMANEPDFQERVTKVKNGEKTYEDIMVSKGFRKWCKHLLEKAGMDKKESEWVYTDDFKIDNIDGLLDFFSAALYEYLAAGNRFDLLSKDDFQASLEIRDIDEITKVKEARSPQTGESLGVFEIKKGKHRELKAKSPCPSYLSEKRKVNQ
jgi:hypothetical protein